MSNSVLVSGGFDPLHVGHLNLINEATRFGDQIWVVVETDSFVNKKHAVLTPQAERAQIIRSLSGVSKVMCNNREDGDCSWIIDRYRPSVFVVGPDHVDLDTLPEIAICRRLGVSVRVMDHLEKNRSSSDIAAKLRNLPVTVSALIHRSNKAVLVGESQSGYCLIGGFVEPGESLEEALIREVSEEIGTSLAGLSYHSSRRGTYFDGRQVLSTYFTAVLNGEPVTSKEISSIKWVDSPIPLSTDCDTAALLQFFNGWVQ